MKFHLEIDCNNAAFQNDDPEIEVARILRQHADQLDNGGWTITAALRDINGNTVGRAWITEDGE